MQEQTKDQRIEIYYNKYYINFLNADLLHEALAEIGRVQIIFLANACENKGKFINEIFSEYLHKVTTRQLGFDREGNDFYE